MIDLHSEAPTPDEDVLELMRERMYAFIFPNHPTEEEDVETFEKAVLWQYQHDYTLLSKLSKDIPEGVKSFKIGDFQMAFATGVMDDKLTRRTICPSVYGLLLRNGLLYKGVEGRCF